MTRNDSDGLKKIAGKFTISAGNTIMPVYTAELYPTPIRNAGVGAGNFAGGAALILVPYLSLLVSRRRSHPIPITFPLKCLDLTQNKIQSYYLMALLASFSFFGSFVVIFLPESMISDDQQTKKASLTNSEEQDEER